MAAAFAGAVGYLISSRTSAVPLHTPGPAVRPCILCAGMFSVGAVLMSVPGIEFLGAVGGTTVTVKYQHSPEREIIAKGE